jgi:hypothetical protein
MKHLKPQQGTNKLQIKRQLQMAPVSEAILLLAITHGRTNTLPFRSSSSAKLCRTFETAWCETQICAWEMILMEVSRPSRP